MSAAKRGPGGSTNARVTVTHNQAAERFEAQLAGQLAVLQYTSEPARIIFLHTEVPAGLRGRGIAQALTHAALSYARDQHLAIVARCEFVGRYLRQHPEFGASEQA